MLAQCLFLRTETMLELILFVLSQRKRNYLPIFVNQITLAHRWFRFTREKKKNLVTLFKAIQKSIQPTLHSGHICHCTPHRTVYTGSNIDSQYVHIKLCSLSFGFVFTFFVPEENSSRWLCLNDSLHVLHIWSKIQFTLYRVSSFSSLKEIWI